MTQNDYQGSDVLGYLADIIPETEENHLIECQELFRIDLTQAMRNLRKATGLTQKDVAEKLGVTQSWVSKLESANNDHTFESIIAYLNALGADFEALIYWQNKKFTSISTELGNKNQNSKDQLKNSEIKQDSNLKLIPIESQESKNISSKIGREGFWRVAA